MLNKELRELKYDISLKKHPRLNKILESDKIDNIIDKIQNLYNKISSKLILKYNLEDEIKQGKIFTILIAIIIFILLIAISIFFAVAMNSIIGFALIFSLFRQIIFCFKWGYTIIKNKGKTIKKYLSNLFPNSKILKEVKERKTIPLYEEQILYQIEDFIEELNRSNINIEKEKEITIKLKEVVSMLNINNLTFKDNYYSLDYKMNIQKQLTEIYNIYYNEINKKEKQEEFLELKNDLLEQINDYERKILIKK